ncbi:MAG TPA: hypothetical protein VN973_10975 [Candidatus Dormibacteraeota bacterium]|nr:hypothetical protein [Candidatus Dormibacteraeota bacterium]
MDPILGLALLGIYLAPTLIALVRRTQLIVLVCVLNVFLGWTASLALAMLLPGDRARHAAQHGVAGAEPDTSLATPDPVAVGASGSPRELEFLLSPVRVAVLGLLAPVLYPLWWFWGFFEFARQERFPRTASFWWIFVPFYGWAIIGRLFHDLEARLGARRPAGFNPQVAVALLVAGIVSMAQALRLPIPISIVTFAMGMALIAVALYRVQGAVNALLFTKYPGGTGAGMVPAELVAATAGFLLVGTLALGAAPSLGRFSESVSSALANRAPESNSVFQPTIAPTIGTVPTVAPTAAPTVPPQPVEGTGALSLTSERGDYIGGGRSIAVASPSWQFWATYIGPDTIWIMAESGTGLWTVNLAAPRGQPLRAGAYSNAERASFRSESAPGIDVSGESRGCNRVSGSFAVKTVTVGPGGQLRAFEASFEQRCEGMAPALRGTIRFDAPAAS